MAPPPRPRLTFLDAARGIAIILMVLNHTSRDWMSGAMTWPRYYLIYGSLLYPATIFLFLAGFCLPISYHRAAPKPPAAAVALGAFRRGVMIVAAGYLLNVLISGEKLSASWDRLDIKWDNPLTNGGVLQTIGLAVILLGAAVPLLRSRAARWSLLAVAVVLYLSFTVALPALVPWTRAYPLLSRVFFNDFPPWPWLSPAIIGLVLGWTWLDARAEGTETEARFFRWVALAGVACLVMYAAWEWWLPTTPRFGFRRDFSLNSHWTPRGMTLALIGGGLAVLMAAAYWLLERRRLSARWLVALGQTAMMLYFVHQVIELTLVNKLLGLRFNAWPVFWTANVVFLVLLVGLAYGWQAFKARRRPAPRAA
jgi:uncharacterized membrane protein